MSKKPMPEVHRYTVLQTVLASLGLGILIIGCIILAAVTNGVR